MNKRMTQEEFERLSREFDEPNGDCIRDAKPKPVAVVSMPVSNSDAEVIAANPESVRISAIRKDGVTVLAKPNVMTFTSPLGQTWFGRLTKTAVPFGTRLASRLIITFGAD